MALSLTAFSLLSADTHTLYIIAFVVLLGCSMGLITTPNNSIVMSRTPKMSLGLMGSMIALCRNLGMMFGAAAGGLLLRIAPGTGETDEKRLSLFSQSIRDWYIAMAVIIAAALLVFLWVVRQDRKKEDSGLHGLRKQQEMV